MSETLAAPRLKIPSPLSRSGITIVAVATLAVIAAATMGERTCVGTAMTTAEVALPKTIG